MKQVDDCTTLAEIRSCIDEIDSAIIVGLARRSTYVKCAAKFKNTVAEVGAADRVKSMLATRRRWAEEKGINPDFIQHLFETIVKFFIANEKNEWLKERSGGNSTVITDAQIPDARTILSLQKRAYVQEAELNGGNFNIPPMLQTLQEMEKDFSECIILKAARDARIIGSVRAKQIGETCQIGRLIVEPIYQKQGVGMQLLAMIESRFTTVKSFELFTGAKSAGNIAFYKKAGYGEEEAFTTPDGTKLVRLKKHKA